MGIEWKRLLMIGFAVPILLSQNLSLGYCLHAETVFVGACPCSEVENPSCPCHGEPGGCSVTITFELDDFLVGESLAVASREAVDAPIIVEQLPHWLRGDFVDVGSTRLLRDAPPPGGVEWLRKISVAQI